MRVRNARLMMAILPGLLLGFALRMEGAGPRPAYRSPFLLAMAPDGKRLYATDRTAGSVAFLDTAAGKKSGEVPGLAEPTGLALSRDGKRLFVAEYRDGKVALVDTGKRQVTARAPVGVRPMGIALGEKSKRLYVCNQGSTTVSVLDAAALKPLKQIPVVREPMFCALTPDEKRLIVANSLPLGRGTDPALSARVSLIDTQTLKVTRSIALPPGSVNLRTVCVSPDGQWAYLVHSLGRFNVPTTQLERGWVNTNALTILDMAKGERYATMLLDLLSEGAADPFGAACSPDGKRLWVSVSGAHQVASLDLAKLHELLSGKVPAELAAQSDPSMQNPWQAIAKSPSAETREPLSDDLTALYIADVIQRVPAGGQGPHGVALSPDGRKAWVANYYSGTVTALDTASTQVATTISLGAQPAPDLVRRGEMVFHDANITFQHWQSCATCHPNQGRVDGLNWDLMNDGLGNPKSNKSLLLSHKTPPMMALGVREDFASAVRAGFTFNMTVPPEESVRAVIAYLSSLKPEPSPHLGPGGKLAPAAERGKKVFEGKAACARCHPSPLFTDKKQYDVGTRGDQDTDPNGTYDTPTLVEVYRTAPYLHDGRALTLQEVLAKWNKGGRHGKTSGLSRKEMDDLVAYVLSL